MLLWNRKLENSCKHILDRFRSCCKKRVYDETQIRKDYNGSLSVPEFVIFPSPWKDNDCSREAFCFTSHRARGSLTVEAAVTVPIFLLCMVLILQLGNACGWAARCSNAMGQTAQEMAIAAYMGDGKEEPVLPEVVVSLAFAQGRIMHLAGSPGLIRKENLLLSSVMQEKDRIDLVMTYQINNPFGIVKMPGTFWLQKASARAWTGRSGSGGKEEDGGEEHRTVYMTETGTVYHTDPSCTHIKLNIMTVSKQEALHGRNVYGAKYYPCEHCGGGDGTVYITTDGNRYHSSLSCPGLKRTVREVDISEVGDIRCCSKCAKKG